MKAYNIHINVNDDCVGDLCDQEYAQVMNGQEEIDRKIAIEQQDEVR